MLTVPSNPKQITFAHYWWCWMSNIM